MPVQEYFVLPRLLESTQYKDFFLTVNYFDSFVPIAPQATQAAVLGRLSLSMSLFKIDLLSNIQKARRRQTVRRAGGIGRWAGQLGSRGKGTLTRWREDGQAI